MRTFKPSLHVEVEIVENWLSMARNEQNSDAGLVTLK
jgi:hypothetical protein